MTNLTKWFKGIVAAAISGAAMAVTTVIADPVHFNTSTPGLIAAAKVAGVAAVVGVGMYLRKSPIWD